VIVPWSLTITAPGRMKTTMGVAHDHEAAVNAALVAVRAAIDEASSSC